MYCPITILIIQHERMSLMINIISSIEEQRRENLVTAQSSKVPFDCSLVTVRHEWVLV